MRRLIDDGPDRVELWAAAETVDEYGTPVMGVLDPETTPPDRVVRTHVQRVGSTEGSQDLGQSVTGRYTFATSQRVPEGAWSVARWQGRWYDVDGEAPRVGRSARTAHQTVTLVSRAPRS